MELCSRLGDTGVTPANQCEEKRNLVVPEGWRVISVVWGGLAFPAERIA